MLIFRPCWAEEAATFEDKFINSNIAVSEWFDGVADGLDLFLVGKRLTTKSNETNVKLESSVSVNAESKPLYSNGVNVNLRLPNVEEYWNLKFTSYDDSVEKRATVRSPLRRTPREKKYGATVGLFQKVGAVRVSFQPRISLGNVLKISHSLNFESILDFKTFKVNPKLELFARPEDGTGMFLAANVYVPLGKFWSFTLINDGEYFEKTHLFSVSNGFSFGEVLTESTSMSYDLIFDSNNQPSYHLNAYSLAVTFHKVLYKEILDYSYGPHLTFTREKSFRSVPGLSVAVGLNF